MLIDRGPGRNVKRGRGRRLRVCSWFENLWERTLYTVDRDDTAQRHFVLTKKRFQPDARAIQPRYNRKSIQIVHSNDQ